ncbi:unnamed protein product, partial [Durusdinium trenchii]
MLGKVGHVGPMEKSSVDADELDERTRYQLKAILQFLQEKELIESLVALESETGVKYVDGDLPVAGLLQSSLDMFGRSGASSGAAAELEDADAKAAEEALQALRGVLVATADRTLRLVTPQGVVEYKDLSSPPLALDVFERQVLVTTMGGEAQLLQLCGSGYPDAEQFTFQHLQSFKDHQKQVTSGRFAEDGEHFATISRDHSAKVYRRDRTGSFALLGAWTMAGEVTACCWLGDSLLLCARDDHELHYLTPGETELKETLRVNLNARGDRVVSFAILALCVAPSGTMLAACTDKSRVIVLQARSNRQLRNLYGASVN